jgi:adenylate cyclase
MKWSLPLIGLLTLPLLFNAVPLQVLKLKTFDAFIETPDPTGYFSILNITEEDLDAEGGYPLPRETLARIHTDLRANGAIGVGWVMLFPHPDRLGGDEEFAAALINSPSVIGMPEVNNGLYPATHGTVIKGVDVEIPKAAGFLENIEVLKGSASQGAISANVDVDNLVRQLPLLQQTPDGWVASFGTEVLKILGGGNTYQIVTNENGIEMVRVRGLNPIPTDSLGRKWISWVDTPQTTLQEMDVQDKFVFVGFTAKGIMPQLATPVGLLEPHKIQAALAESILLNTPQIPDYHLLVELLILCLSGLCIALLINFLGMTSGVLAVIFAICSVGYLGLHFISINQLIDVTWAMVGMVLVATQQFYLNFRKQFKLRQQIKKQFEHYLDPAQVKRLQSNPELLKLGGEKRYCTFLFTDVRGFTAMSESLEPEQVALVMNKALTVQQKAVQKHGGMVDKYIGDAMMAIFNAPLDLEHHEQKAVDCALDMQQGMLFLNDELEKEGLPPIDIGIGINTGEAVVGNMGSETRFDYTAIGDAVNTAARTESACKEAGHNLLITKKTIEKCSNAFEVLKPIPVKGKSEPLKINTII